MTKLHVTDIITNLSSGVAYLTNERSPDVAWYFVVTSTDGRIFHMQKPWHGGTASPYGGFSWTEMDGGGGTPSAPAAVAILDYIFVAVRGYDNSLYLNRGTPGQPFLGWQF